MGIKQHNASDSMGYIEQGKGEVINEMVVQRKQTGFYLRAETDSSLRNVVFNKKIIIK
jgi:hypothetical protein